MNALITLVYFVKSFILQLGGYNNPASIQQKVLVKI